MNVRLPTRLTAQLPAGQLDLDIEASLGPVQDYLDFAARVNPRRAFLFLSKVLGKHYPAKPSKMAEAHAALAGQVPAGVRPIVFVGMAETATGLGQGVFEAWLARHPGGEALFIHTTRYRVEGASALPFEEAHSHAPRVFLHLPTDTAQLDLLRRARLAVLIDDELSTGNTFVNLARVLLTAMPGLEAIHLSTIADFMGQERRAGLMARMGLPCGVGCILRGSWSFQADPHAVGDPAPPAQCAAGQEIWLPDTGYGRLGRAHALRLPEALVQRLAAEPVVGETLMLGTGEFMHTAFALGYALEQRGCAVRVQATTRSPILPWGAVRYRDEVPDAYGEALPNYLYNRRPDHYGRVLICHEASLGAEPSAPLYRLAGQLNGRLIHFQPNDDAQEITVR